MRNPDDSGVRSHYCPTFTDSLLVWFSQTISNGFLPGVLLLQIWILFMSLCTLFWPQRSFCRRGIDWEEQGWLQRRGARLGAYVKLSNSAEGVGSKGGPGFALWEQQGFGRAGSNPFVSMLIRVVSLPSLLDPSVTKQRLLFWHQCASSSDFRELWVRLLRRNLELGCLRALPAHFAELSSCTLHV